MRLVVIEWKYADGRKEESDITRATAGCYPVRHRQTLYLKMF
jgi:hypothetical protein